MSDEAAKHFDERPPPETPSRSFTLSITLQPNGALELTGPLHNKVLAFGLLGAAHAQLTSLHLKTEMAQAAQSRGGLAGLRTRMNGG